MQNQGARRAGQRTLGDVMSRASLPAVAIFAGLVVSIIGSVAPWATTPLSSASGTSGDGKITIAIGIVGLLLLVRGAARSWAWLVALSVILLALGLFEAIHIHHEVTNVTLFGKQIAHVGWGVYAVIAGGVIADLGAWYSRPANR